MSLIYKSEWFTLEDPREQYVSGEVDPYFYRDDNDEPVTCTELFYYFPHIEIRPNGFGSYIYPKKIRFSVHNIPVSRSISIKNRDNADEIKIGSYIEDVCPYVKRFADAYLVMDEIYYLAIRYFW